MAAVNPFVSLSISLGSELAAIAQRLRDVTVLVHGRNGGNGSGVIWRPDGVIVTNAHVADSSTCRVEFADGRRLAAVLLRRDPGCDLAVLKAGAHGLGAAEIRDASSLRTGELVLAMGNPMGVAGALAVGLVSASPLAEGTLLRADIRLAPGNSGGPLADARGQVVGINSMVVDGFGVAVTSGTVRRFLAGLCDAYSPRFGEVA